MAKYNDSLPFDKVFYRQDIAGSIAFARANVKTGILTREEFQQIEKGLLQVQQEWASGAFQVMEGDEVSNDTTQTIQLTPTRDTGHSHGE